MPRMENYVLSIGVHLYQCNQYENCDARSVIKVNGGDAEESNYLFPAHLLDNLHEDDANKVANYVT